MQPLISYPLYFFWRHIIHVNNAQLHQKKKKSNGIHISGCQQTAIYNIQLSAAVVIAKKKQQTLRLWVRNLCNLHYYLMRNERNVNCRVNLCNALLFFTTELSRLSLCWWRVYIMSVRDYCLYNHLQSKTLLLCAHIRRT